MDGLLGPPIDPALLKPVELMRQISKTSSADESCGPLVDVLMIGQ